jgi:enediyne biosynthesis protein E4
MKKVSNYTSSFWFPFFTAVLFVTTGCKNDPKEELLFQTPGAESSGLNFINTLTETDALNILDYLYFYNGGGVAIGDINNDGLPDIYLTGNQVPNKLFLNKGNMQFEDITESAGVAGNSSWNTGVTMADVNGDGYLDIYVCAVVGINGLRGKNELFINNGDNTFSEDGEKYGLDIQNYSSTAAFFDYDNDGDLDMYLLNHAVHTVNTYGPAEIRNNRTVESGDKLFRNDNGKFVDVSEEAGIYGGANGYGLGLATADFNNNGFTDIYVSNDFHEDDYYYLNNGDGTFTEVLKEKFTHVSRFSMGSDVADVNHDGYLDILTLDMLPEDEKVLKASLGDDPLDLHNMKINRLNYHQQYTRNMLQINRSGEYFQEMGLYSGLAATDWSWSPLFVDLDMDGNQDVFIATGIPRRPNDLDYIKYVSNEQIQKKITTTKLVDQKALDMMPSGKVHNYILSGAGNLKFSDQSGKWISRDSIISTGAAWGDLDNDGDIDIVTNNINHPATLYVNSSAKNSSYLKIKMNFTAPNTFGIGSKVISYQNGEMQVKQLYTARGFQSSSEPIIHFGYGDLQKVDSLLVIWPDNTAERFYELELNQTLSLTPSKNREKVDYNKLFPKPKPLFTKVDSLPGMDYIHKENNYVDFNRQKLIPYKISDRGPASVVADFNGDGMDDIFLGGSKLNPSRIYFQDSKGFSEQKFSEIINDSITEDVSVVAADFSNNGKPDLFVVSGGGEFYGESKALLDRYYVNDGNTFSKKDLPSYFENGAVVKVLDYDNDGYPDLFVGGGAVSNDFGKIPGSYILKNNKGSFSLVENKDLKNVGMVTDAVWSDFDGDGHTDLIIVGEWMGPRFFRNENGVFKDRTSQYMDSSLNGLWQSIIPFDINGDGEMDYLLGNWGLNTKFTATTKEPLKMYYGDFDGNGSTETIVAYAKNGNYYPVAGLDELVSQLSYLRKRFPAYRDFAGKTIEEIFDKDQLNNSTILTVQTLASGYLLNSGGTFTFKEFEAPLQVAPITSFLIEDFNSDGEPEVLVAGNYFGVTPYHGNFSSLAGNMITSAGKIIEGDQLGLNLTQKSVREMEIIRIKGEKYLMITINNDKPQFYKLAE